MKLELSQIKDITTGAVRIEQIDQDIHFFRFTKHQEELYQARHAGFYAKSFSTSGVQLRFLTNSETLFLDVDVSHGSTRSYFTIEVFANGERVGVIKNYDASEMVGKYVKKPFPSGNFSKKFSLGAGEKEIRIYFPWSVKVTLKALCLDDDAFVKPAKPVKKLLCYGDSITHGYDALYPSNKYTTKLAQLLDAQEYNKGIGGEIYFPALAAAKEDFQPDYIVVAYGSNDWSKCTREELSKNCGEFLSHVTGNYPNIPIFVITPIWRKDMHNQTPCDDFTAVHALIEKQAADYPNMLVIRGFEFVPPDVAYFADLALHPNDRGFEFYVENLYRSIKAYLNK